MSLRTHVWLLLLLFPLFSAGCSNSSSNSEGESATATDSPTLSEEAVRQFVPETGNDGKPVVPFSTQAESIAGRWVLVLTEEGQQEISDFYVYLFDVSPVDEGYALEVASVGRILSEPKILDSQIDEKRLQVAMEIDGKPFKLRGELQSGYIRGTLTFEGAGIDPARLFRTTAESLDEFAASHPTSGFEGMQALVEAKEPFSAVMEYCDRFQHYPLALNGYSMLLRNASENAVGHDVLDGLIDRYFEAAKHWGPLMQARANTRVGIALSMSPADAEQAMEYLDAAERLLTPDVESWGQQIEAARDTAEIMLASKKLEGSADEQAAALKTLRKQHQKHPYHAQLTLLLADRAAEAGRRDEAIDYYAELVVLPLLQQMIQQTDPSGGKTPLPQEKLTRLWTEKHGDANGLEEFLDRLYRERIDQLLEKTTADAKLPPADQLGNHVVLVEAFTGAQCPPCVAAELALTGLTRVYPDERVVALHYHQHVAGPDPLVNQDSEARQIDYGASGAPAVYVDGARVEPVGGILNHVAQSFSAISSAVNERLTVQTPIEIQLEATANDGDLAISARALNLPDEDLGELRLRLALAESFIDFKAPNGIRWHSMVVRAMPGTPDGVPADQGGLTFEETIPLASFRNQIGDYLARYEAGTGIKFPVKPLNLKPLKLVALVQHEKTRQVLQTAVVDVTGEIVYPGVEQPSAQPTSPASRPTADAAAPANAAAPAGSADDGTAPADAMTPANAAGKVGAATRAAPRLPTPKD